MDNGGGRAADVRREDEWTRRGGRRAGVDSGYVDGGGGVLITSLVKSAWCKDKNA